MKVNYKHLIQSYRGKLDGLVYYYHPGLERCLARKHVIPRFTENNRRWRAIGRNLRDLQPSPGFRDDLRVYLYLRGRRPALPVFNGNLWNLFTTLMWAQARAADLDLETLTRAEIEALELPCRTVKTAVEAGLLPEVTGYELLVREL